MVYFRILFSIKNNLVVIKLCKDMKKIWRLLSDRSYFNKLYLVNFWLYGKGKVFWWIERLVVVRI